VHWEMIVGPIYVTANQSWPALIEGDSVKNIRVLDTFWTGVAS